MKFCENCGQQMEDGEVFCVNCGAVQKAGETITEQYQQNEYHDLFTQDTYRQDNIKEKKKSKVPLVAGLSVIIVSILVAIVLIVILLVNRSTGGGNSAKSVAQKFLKAYFIRYDGSEAMNYLAYSRAYRDDARYEFSDLEDMEDYIKDFHYDIVSVQQMSRDEREDFWYYYDESVYVDEEDVSELTKVKVKASFKSSNYADGEFNDFNITLYMGKYLNEWKVIYMKL